MNETEAVTIIHEALASIREALVLVNRRIVLLEDFMLNEAEESIEE